MVLRLQLLPTSYFFVLDLNSALTIDINSSIFNNQNDFIGSISYTGTMPLEPNRKAIRNAQYLATDVALRTLDVMMWLNYLPYKQVKMNFTIQDNTINYNLYIDSGIIANQLKNLQLNQLSTPGISSQLSFGTAADLKAYMLATAQGAPGAFPMVFFPYRNDGAYTADAYLSYYTYGDPLLGAFPYQPGVKFRYNGLVGNNRIYNTVAASAAGVTPDTNPANFTDITITADIYQPVSAVINRWQLDAAGNGSFAVEGFPVSNTQTPFFLVTYVLQRIAQYFGYTWDGQWMTEDDANRLTIFSNIAVGSTFILGDLTLFMPGILVSDFLKELRTSFGLLIDFDQTRKVMVVESLVNLETKAEKIDLRTEQVIAGYQETGLTSQAYVISQSPDDKDGMYANTDKGLLPQLVIGDPASAVQETDIPLLSVITQMISETMPSDPAVPVADRILSNYTTPAIKMPILATAPLNQVSTLAYADRLSFKLRFIYYWGMVNSDGGYSYPYGSVNNEDVSGNILGAFTLALTGVASPALLNYYNFLAASKPFQMVFMLSAGVLAKIKANTTIIVTDPVLQTAQVCILSQLSADFEPEKEKIVSTLTLYPIVQPNNAAPVINTAPPPPPPPPFDNGLVYARLVEDNETENIEMHPSSQNSFFKDISVRFFSDAAGTIPKAVTDLVVGYSTAFTEFPGPPTVTHISHVTGNGTSQLLQAAAPIAVNTTDGSGRSSVWEYALSPSSKYTIIS